MFATMPGDALVCHGGGCPHMLPFSEDIKLHFQASTVKHPAFYFSIFCVNQTEISSKWFSTLEPPTPFAGSFRITCTTQAAQHVIYVCQLYILHPALCMTSMAI